MRRAVITTGAAIAAFSGWALVVVLMVALCSLVGCLPNGSTDGRRHTCGYVTDQGVTEHLAEYQARCGQVTP